MSGNFVKDCFSYYELFPRYECRFTKDGPWQICERQDFCWDNLGVEYRVDWTYGKSLSNWVQLYEMDCFTSFKISMLGSAYFIGYMIASVTVLRLADIFGRKKIFLLNQTV